MWEAIESNKRRSWILIGTMGAMLVLFGALIGAAIHPSAAVIGAGAALLVWLVLLLTATLGGDQVLLHSVGARKLQSREEHPRLWNVVEEMSIASGLGRVPSIHVIESTAPNAFAVGMKRDKASVAVTSGLLERLSRDELQGVMAHEIAHIVNRDVRFMTLAGVMVGAIVILADLFLRFLIFGGGGRRRSSGKGADPRVQVAIIAAAVLAAILAPLFARILYFSCSRRREYLADASGARFTRYPEGLASALEKIAAYAARSKTARKDRAKNRTMAPMYIINPLRARGAAGLFSTHPPTDKRIAILRGMGGGADYAAYEAAYQKILGANRHCIGDVTLSAQAESVAAREPSPAPDEKKDAVARAREVTDLLDRIGGYALFACACGVGIKIPPGYDREHVPCPRCGRQNRVPTASPGKGDTPGTAEKPLEYRRIGKGWESFRCRCGNTVQLSPAHAAPKVVCSKCRRKIDVLQPKSEAAAKG